VAAPPVAKARAGGAGGTPDKEQLLRAELGSLREELGRWEAQCASLSLAAARAEEAELRAATLAKQLDVSQRDLSIASSEVREQRRLRAEGVGAESKAAAEAAAAAQAFTEQLAEKDRTIESLRAEHEALKKEHTTLTERAEKLWNDLQERDMKVTQLSRELKAVDSSPRAMHPEQRSTPPPQWQSGQHGQQPQPGRPAAAVPAQRPPNQRPSAQTTRGRPPPPSSWKCQHCTFENKNKPIYDPATLEYKGICEICQNVSKVRA